MNLRSRFPYWLLIVMSLVLTGQTAWQPLYAQENAQESVVQVGLWGLATWTNPPEDTTASSKSKSSWSGLLGPIVHTNPSSAGRQDGAQQESTTGTLAVGSKYGLTGPFHWQNPQSKQRSNVTKSNAALANTERNEFGQSINLWGPLVWQNERQVPVEPTRIPTMPLEPRARYAEKPFLLMQGEELINPGSNLGGETIPIPSNVLGTETIPLPDVAGSPGVGGGSLAEADSLGEEPTDNRLQFLRTDTVLLEPGELQFDIGVSYQLFENDFSVVNNANQVVEARIKQRQLTVPIEFRYGLARRLQFFIGAPLGWAQTDFAVLGTDIRDSDGGIGDVTTGLTMLLFDGHGRKTDTVFTLAASFPTGNDPLTINLLGQADPALGSGFYSISTDLLKITTYDPVVVFYGFGWRHQFESNFFGIAVQPGEEFRANLGIGFAVNQNITLSTRFNASVITQTRLDDVQVDGTLLEPMTIRFAATILNCDRLIEPFAEIGTSDDAASSRFGITWTY